MTAPKRRWFTYPLRLLSALVLWRTMRREWDPDAGSCVLEFETIRKRKAELDRDLLRRYPQPFNRRWFRFGLTTLVVVATVAVCVAWWTKDSWAPWINDPDEWVDIADVGDPGTMKAMFGLLRANGI